MSPDPPCLFWSSPITTILRWITCLCIYMHVNQKPLYCAPNTVLCHCCTGSPVTVLPSVFICFQNLVLVYTKVREFSFLFQFKNQTVNFWPFFLKKKMHSLTSSENDCSGGVGSWVSPVVHFQHLSCLSFLFAVCLSTLCSQALLVTCSTVTQSYLLLWDPWSGTEISSN